MSADTIEHNYSSAAGIFFLSTSTADRLLPTTEVHPSFHTLTMPTPPPCRSLGKHCREITLTVRISDIEDESQTLQDASATWMTAHRERISFGKPYVRGFERLVDATIHVPCKYLETPGGHPAVRPDGKPALQNGARPKVRCAAHRFRGTLPQSTQIPLEDQPSLKRPNQTFSVIYKNRRRSLKLPFKRSARRALPVVQSENPCVGAPCRTSDNKVGAACCRDLTLEIDLPKTETRLEALLRARRSPYVCRIRREDEDTMECEVLTACGYLDDGDGITCHLHDRVLPNGRIAKPSLCYEWPDLKPDEEGHPGCVFAK